MANRRSADDVVQKRRAGRQFNETLSSATGTIANLDGRTKKKHQRLVDELKAGRARSSGAPLKPVEILNHVTALLSMGETVTTLKRLLPVPRAIPRSDELLEVIRTLQAAYQFPLEAFEFIGIEPKIVASVTPRPGLTKGSRKRRDRAVA